MKRIVFGVIGAVLAAAPAWADIKMVQGASGKVMGMNGNSVTTTYIKGLKMRTDTVDRDTTRTMIFDVDAQKMYMFDSKKKDVDVWDMADFSKQVGTTIDPEGVTASIKPNGQTKTVAGKAAAGYDMAISMPTTMGGNADMKMTVALTGPVWIVKGAPGTEDFMRFYKAAAEKGFIFSDPRAAKGQPGTAKATTEMYRQLAAIGGVPYETEMNIKMSGDGPMAALMSRMGNFTMTTTVQSVDTAALEDTLFAPPVGYKLSQKK